MRIRMKVSAPGSEDGYTSRVFTAGESYEVTPELAETFIASKLAVEVSTPTARGKGRAG